MTSYENTTLNTERSLQFILQEKENQIKELKLKNEKIQNQNNKIRNYANQLEQILNLSHKNIPADTSSNFPLRSEFIKLWNQFSGIDILSNFVEFEQNHFVFYHLIREMFYLMVKNVSKITTKMYYNVGTALNLKSKQNYYNELAGTIKPFIKEYLNDIYSEDNEYADFKEEYRQFFFDKLLKNTKATKNDQNEIDKLKNTFNEVFNAKEFIGMLSRVKGIVLFSEFNDPKLDLNIKEYNPKDGLEIQKFEKNKCVVFGSARGNNFSGVLVQSPPLLKSGFPLIDLKPIVLGVDDEVDAQTPNNNISTSNSTSNGIIRSNSSKSKQQPKTARGMNTPNIIIMTQREKDKLNYTTNLGLQTKKKKRLAHPGTKKNISKPKGEKITFKDFPKRKNAIYYDKKNYAENLTKRLLSDGEEMNEKRTQSKKSNSQKSKSIKNKIKTPKGDSSKISQYYEFIKKIKPTAVCTNMTISKGKKSKTMYNKNNLSSNTNGSNNNSNMNIITNSIGLFSIYKMKKRFINLIKTNKIKLSLSNPNMKKKVPNRNENGKDIKFNALTARNLSRK